MPSSPSAGHMAGDANPERVHTPDELATALNALRGDHSYGDLSKAVRSGKLVKSTISDLLTGKTRPSAGTLELFLDACRVPAEQRGPWRAARERALTSQPPIAGAIRVQQAAARHLGVHAAIDAPGTIHELPVYVERDTDTAPRGVRALIAQAAERGGMVVLVGDSSTGKTRCAFEAVTTQLPQWWLIHPTNAAQLQTLAAEPLPKAVVWLDELQRYLDADRGLSAATVRALLQANTVIVATLWPNWHITYITQPPFGDPDLFQVEREILKLADVVHIDARFSAPELERARRVAVADPRICLALQSDDYGLIQTIAAAPQLIARWNAADPYAKAILTAAVDATRLGVETPLSGKLLREAASGYCDTRQRANAPANWFETAMAYATELLHGAAAALSPVAEEMGQITGYTVAHYLLQHATAERQSAKIPSTIWDAFLQDLTDPSDQTRVAISAMNELLYRYAESLYWKAVDAGDKIAAYWLVKMLVVQGRVEEAVMFLWARADAGDKIAAYRLAELLTEQGRVDEIRERADAGDEQAAYRLAELLFKRGWVEELQNRADAGDKIAADRLIKLLVERGWVEKLRARADVGDDQAADRLVELLVDQGLVEEAATFVWTRTDDENKYADYWRSQP